jgi:carbon storage regulator
MLVLSRRANEDIVIVANGVEIVVKTIEIRGDKARLGIEAPQSVTVHRREIHEIIRGESVGHDVLNRNDRDAVLAASRPA